MKNFHTQPPPQEAVGHQDTAVFQDNFGEIGSVFSFVLGQAIEADPDFSSTSTEKIFKTVQSDFVSGNSERGWADLEGRLVDIEADGSAGESHWTDIMRGLSIKLTDLEPGPNISEGFAETIGFLEANSSEETLMVLDQLGELQEDGPEKVEVLNILLGKIEDGMAKAAFRSDVPAEFKAKLRLAQHEVYLERQTVEETINPRGTWTQTGEPARAHQGEERAEASSQPEQTTELTRLDKETADERFREVAEANMDVYRGPYDETRVQGFIDLVTARVQQVIAQRDQAISQGEFTSEEKYLDTIGSTIGTAGRNFLGGMVNKRLGGLTSEDLRTGTFDSLSLASTLGELGIDVTRIPGFNETFRPTGNSLDRINELRSRNP